MRDKDSPLEKRGVTLVRKIAFYSPVPLVRRDQWAVRAEQVLLDETVLVVERVREGKMLAVHR